MGRHSVDQIAVPAGPVRQPTTGRTRAEEREYARQQAKATRSVWRRHPLVPAVGAAAVLAWSGTEMIGVFDHGATASARPEAAAAPAGSITVVPSVGDTGDFALPGTASANMPAGVAAPSLQRVSRDTRDPADLVLDTGPVQQAVIPGKTVPGTWVRPSSGEMSSCFCMRWGTMHEGIDLAAPMGAPIVAVGDGVVIEAGPAEGFGHWIVIRHSNGDVSIYGHMYSVLVTVGEKVKAGQLIAHVGEDGEATGPHLHFGVMKGGMNGTYIDPVPWLKARGITVGPYNPNA